jgi:hypothetical protein
MLLDFQKFDITLGTLDEGTSAKRTLPGTLDVCENATFPKKDRIDKRLGLALVDVQHTVDGSLLAPANVFLGVGVAHGELLVFGVTTLFALAERRSNLGDGALVPRGPALNGGADVQHIATSQLSAE